MIKDSTYRRSGKLNSSNINFTDLLRNKNKYISYVCQHMFLYDATSTPTAKTSSKIGYWLQSFHTRYYRDPEPTPALAIQKRPFMDCSWRVLVYCRVY